MKSVMLTRILSLAVPAALAIPLCLAAGCLSSDAIDDETAMASATSTESLGGVCHVVFPISWSVGESRCVIRQGTRIDMAAGETVDLATPVPPPPGFGVGRVRLTCNVDGSVTESRKSCNSRVIIDPL